MKKRWTLTIMWLVVLALAGCAHTEQPHPVHGNPLYGTKLYNGQAINAASAEHELRQMGRSAEAEQVARIADQPTATWLSGGPDGQFDHVLVANILAATKPDETPVFVLYNLPNRDAGEEYSRGGAENIQAYKEWADSILSELGSRRTIVIMEPDSVAAMARGKLNEETAREDRFELIRYVLRGLKNHPGSHAYLDAGNPGWTHPDEMAGLLRRAGVDMADGIAVNVSNFFTDDESAAYGKHLSELVGGAGVVVDRGRNGNGAQKPQNELSYCNPPGRALGQPPAIGGQDDTVNAWLWIKPPGESDGDCHPGDPSAGKWWPDYALGLVKGK